MTHTGSREQLARRAADMAARQAYGRLIALLCQRGADLAQAEDALSSAFVRALDRWSNHGIPESPEAWLLTTARRILIDQARHAEVERRAQADVMMLIERLEQGPADVADRRIDLMMLCAHPSVAANTRAPLMLQTVLGLTAKHMSAAFLISPAAMGQRLARAKRAIRDSGSPFCVPPEEEASRLPDVLDAIYAAFGTAYEIVEHAKNVRHGLAHEAIWLGQILAHQREESAEVHGLLSLMLFVQSRVDARRNSDGQFTPLSKQDRQCWDWRLIARAEHHLNKAAALRQPGRYQIEAAIQSHHVLCEPEQGPDWKAIAGLYDALVVCAPTVAAWVGRAAALGEAQNPAAGLAALQYLPDDRVAGYQPYWAVRAHLLSNAIVGNPDHREKARYAYSRAIGLSEDEAVRAFLREQQKRLDTTGLQ